ncbi:MAG: hypothetical protein NVSMB64_26090 [Candidatus Velthaea sp.]
MILLLQVPLKPRNAAEYAALIERWRANETRDPGHPCQAPYFAAQLARLIAEAAALK